MARALLAARAADYGLNESVPAHGAQPAGARLRNLGGMACNGGGARNVSPLARNGYDEPVQRRGRAGRRGDDDDDDGYGDDDAYDGPGPHGANEEYGGGDAEYGGPTARRSAAAATTSTRGDRPRRPVRLRTSRSGGPWRRRRPRRRRPRRGRHGARRTPVTMEAPDGSRHAMEVELRGVREMGELRDGFLQAYREHLGVALEAHALRVHARMPTGASVLLTEQMALTDALRDAVSFHVFGVIGVSRTPPASTTDHSAHPDPVLGVETPSVLQLKAQLARKAPRRPR